MRTRFHALAALIALPMAAAAAGCAGSSSEPEATSPPTTASGPLSPPEPQPELLRATLAYRAQCPDLSPERCPGGYGLSIDSEGGFRFGPGPEGQTVSGSLAEEDVRELSQALRASVACAEPSGATAIKRFDLSRSDGGKGAACAPELARLAGRIAAKYSPEAFPNPCIDAAFDLERSYAPLLRCERDEQCAYLGEDYLPLPQGSGAEVALDDCSFIRPLAVANAFEAVAGQLPLLLKREAARAVCAKQLSRPHCAKGKSLSPGADGKRPPICFRGTCRPHPSFTMH